MYLKDDKIVVTIKNTVFRSYKIGNPNGELILDPTAMTGWDDGTNVRRDATVRPVSSGDFVEPYTFSARLISLSGTAVASSRGALQRLRDSLLGTIQENEYAEIKVETSAGVRYSKVGLENKIEWIQQLDNVALFRVELYAPDPHIYGGERRAQAGRYSVTGGLTFPLQYPLNYNPDEEAIQSSVTNNGNAISYPTFVAVGDFYSGFSIYSAFGGKKVTYTGMVTKMSPVTIDMKKGTAIQNGVDKTSLLTERNWFGIAPGETLSPVFNGLSNDSWVGRCDIIYRDTWI